MRACVAALAGVLFASTAAAQTPPTTRSPTDPAELPYSGDQPIPPGYRLDSHVLRGPVIAGSVMAGTTYLVNSLGAMFRYAVGVDDRTGYLLVPGVGTWVYVGGACGGGEYDSAAGCASPGSGSCGVTSA